MDVDERVAGVIQKLELTNFMCHASLALDFNSAVNFIVGKNGSGKSAIMTALMVVLGSKATDTSRGKTLLNFIKVGCSQARIKITLSNKGAHEYKREKYGDSVILIRTISKSGGKFTVQTPEGVVHLPRTELDHILQAFNIKLPNPFALLTQETMKTFLSSSKPEKMYDLIREGTGIKEAQHKVAELLENQEYLEMKESEMKKKINEIKKDLKIWMEKRNILDKVTNTKEQISSLENEVLWAKVMEEEAKLFANQKTLQKFITQKRNKEKGLEASQTKLAKLREAIRENDQNLDLWTIQYNNKKGEQDILKQDYEASKAQTVALTREYSAKSGQIKNLKTDRRVIEEGMNKYAQHSSEEEIQKRLEQRHLVERLEAEVSDIQATRQTMHNELRRLQDENRNNMGTISEKRFLIQELKPKCRRERNELEAAKKQTGTLPPVYGSQMGRFLQEIDKAHAQGKFSKKPIGPIGIHVKVQDQSWSLAVESYLRSDFTNFFCNTNEDRITLTNICNRVMPQYRLIVVQSKFMERPFDVRNNKAHVSGNLVNLMDLLEVENPVVMNYLIDQKQVETIVMCPMTQEAMQLMSNSSTVPRNCRVMITKEAEQVFPAPNYRFYSSEIRSVQYMVKSKEDSVKVVEQQIAEDEARVAQLENELQQMERAAKRTQSELNSVQSQMRKMEEKEYSLKRNIENNKADEEIDNQDLISNLQQELDEVRSKIANAEQELVEVKKKLDEAKHEKKTKEDDFQALAEDFEIVHDKCNVFQEKKFELEEQLYSEVEREKREKDKLSKDGEEEAKHTSAVEAQEKKVMAAETIATNQCPRITTNRTVAVIEKDISGLKAFMSSLNSNLEAENVILEKIETFENKIDLLGDKMQVVSNTAKDFKTTITKRKISYLSAVSLTFVHINELFRNLISRQYFEGEIKFFNKEKTLQIRLKGKGKNGEELKNLSGGERSYTTIALILSVWHKLLIPFYMLDEFDVYMDMVNRRVCSDLLISEALGRKGRQFMFFTPQEMNLAASGKVTIHKLADPREA